MTPHFKKLSLRYSTTRVDSLVRFAQENVVGTGHLQSQISNCPTLLTAWCEWTNRKLTWQCEKFSGAWSTNTASFAQSGVSKKYRVNNRSRDDVACLGKESK